MIDTPAYTRDYLLKRIADVFRMAGVSDADAIVGVVRKRLSGACPVCRKMNALDIDLPCESCVESAAREIRALGTPPAQD